VKFRALLGDQFIDVEADSEEAAQEQAFAKTVRSLSPAHFTVWPTGPDDEWGEERGPCSTCRGRGASTIDKATGKTVYYCNCETA
jgi:hypothetical protein